MTTDPASLLPSIACDDCGVTAGLCVYTTGPNAGKPRAARYGPHKCRVDDSVTAARWYDRGVSTGAASRQPDVDAARTRAESAEAALTATQTQLDKALTDLAACQAEHEPAPEPGTDPKWVEALDMTSNALQLTAGVGANDYWLKLIDPHGENDKHLAGGGFVRDRPIGALATPVPAGGWPARMLDNARTEIKMAKKAGLDGLQGCLLTPPGVSPVDNWNRAVAMSKAGAEAKFPYSPLIDCTASFANRTAAAVAADLKTLYAYGAARRIDGELVLSSFKAEAKPPTWWNDLLGLLEADLGPIKFIGVFLNAPADLTPWKFAHALGLWGPASPNGVPGLATFAKRVKDAGCKYMAPVRPLADVRPYEDRWFEGNGSQLSRDMYASANANADYVLVATWDDVGESTALWPSVNHGTALCEINAYYAEWFRTGKQPVITEDKVYLFHRTQPYAAKATMAGVHQANLDKASVPGRDAVEALVFATAPADLTICGTAATVPAGISWPTVPLKVGPAGSITAALTRAGTPVASAVSPFAVTDKPLVPDHTYRVVGS